MRKFNRYDDAEEDLIDRIINTPEFTTKTTSEIFQTGFILTNPENNRNRRSNYEYAQHFFSWLMSGNTDLSGELLASNPWVQRFVDSTGLPAGFSSSYGWKIAKQLPLMMTELKRDSETRRAYLSVLTPDDQVILGTKSTMEFPCTIGIHLFNRYGKLHMIVNMRSNNCYSVMPYDVYNFTMLQRWLAERLGLYLGYYYHQINNAHVFKGDVRRIKQDGL